MMNINIADKYGVKSEFYPIAVMLRAAHDVRYWVDQISEHTGCDPDQLYELVNDHTYPDSGGFEDAVKAIHAWVYEAEPSEDDEEVPDDEE